MTTLMVMKTMGVMKTKFMVPMIIVMVVLMTIGILKLQ